MLLLDALMARVAVSFANRRGWCSAARQNCSFQLAIVGVERVIPRTHWLYASHGMHKNVCIIHSDFSCRSGVMEVTVAERGQITLPKAVRDALGLTKGSVLKIEVEGGRIILRKNVDDAISRVRGRFKLDGFSNTDEAMRAIRGRAPGDLLEM